MENSVQATVPLRVGKKMKKRRELDALVGGLGRNSRLLSASSDEGEPWSRRSIRRRRSRPFVRLAAALALCVCVVSASTVLWLFIDVRRQIVSLRMEIDRVSTSSDSVGDALQICHTAAKELRANTSLLSLRLIKLEQEHLELAKRVDKATGELSAVSDQLAAAPKLADTPRRLAELQRTVADFGSQINSFDGSLNSAKKQAAAAASGVLEVKTSLHDLEGRTNDSLANVNVNSKKEEEIKQQIVALNQTVGARVDELQKRLDDLTKTTSTAAPTSTSTTSSTTTTSTTAQPPTVTLAVTTPDQHVKPSVLH